MEHADVEARAAAGAAEAEAARQRALLAEILAREGDENPYRLHRELGRTMTENMTVVRHNARLDETLEKIVELKGRWRRVGLSDRGWHSNQSLHFTRQLWLMLELAHVMTLGARLRDESRGAHYKPEFPNRDDGRFLKTTIAAYTPDGPSLEYEDVDVQYISPRPRKYDVEKKEATA